MSNIKDLTGSKIGMLELTQRKRENNRTYYYCRCDCGTEKWMRDDNIKNIGHCGCCRIYHFSDITGQRFGRLTAIRTVGSSGNNGKVWECKCDCGTIKNVVLSALKTGKTKSCGCYHNEIRKNVVGKAYEVFKKKNLIENTNLSALKRKSLIKSNTSGYTGVSFNKIEDKWIAFISFKKKRYYLGYFEDIEDAIEVRKEAEKNLHENFLTWYKEAIKNDDN